MILFDNVNLKYDNGRVITNVLKNISFRLPSNGFIALLGKSGSGKSTIFNLISLSIKKTSGKIKVYGYDYDCIDEQEKNLIKKKIVGYIYQDNQLFNNLSVKDNIDTILDVSGILFDEAKEDIEKYSKLLNIDNLMDIEVSKLSGGEKERVAILLTIIRKTKIVLADEPTAALDLENSLLVMETLKELSKERLVIVSSHDVCLLEKYSDEYIKLSYGEIEDISINSKEVITYDPIENKNTLNTFKLSHKLFSRQHVRKVFFIVAQSIAMIFLAISLFNISFNERSFRYYAYKSECDYYVVSNSKSLESNSLFENKTLKEKLKTTKYYYNCNLITNSDLNETLTGYYGKETLISNYIINNDLNDNDVIISDYTKEHLSYLLEKRYDDITNIIVDNEITLNIYKTKETNYYDYKKLDNEQQNGYLRYISDWYNNIELNQNTFNALRHRKKESFEYNGDTYNFTKQSLIGDGNMVVGNRPLNDNEIMVSTGVIYNYFNVEYNQNESLAVYLKDYVGKDITFNINNISYTFKISGIILGYTNYGVSLDLAFNDSFYENFNFVYEDRAVNDSFMAVRPTSYNEYKKVVKKVKNNNYYLLNPLDFDVDDMVSERKADIKVSIYLFAAAFVLEISLLYFMNYSIFKNNRRSIGVLKHNGISNKDILKLMLCDTLLLNVVTSLVGIIAYIIYVILYRNMLEFNSVYFDGSILHFNIWIILLFVLFILVINLILLIINLRYLKKVDNKKLLSEY